MCTPYENHSLMELIEEIILGNAEALWELHQWRLFETANGRRATFGEHVETLREWAHKTGWWTHAGSDVVDEACDLLLDRFRNLPEEKSGPPEYSEEEAGDSEPKGPNCRNYFRAFFKHVTEVFEQCPPRTALETETHVARLLQKFVRRHFYYCIRESLRNRNQLISRYAWHVNGYVFNLWFPKTLKARCEWLKQHIPNPGGLRLWDRDQIQAIIDQHFGTFRLVSWDANNYVCTIPAPPLPDSPPAFAGIAGRTARELIAEEKARTIDQQMPAIQALGPERLKALVLAVLENLVTEKETDRTLAKRWLISFATFSRFAGRGGRGKRQRQRLPALFVNIAHYLGENPHFVHLAKEAGY